MNEVANESEVVNPRGVIQILNQGKPTEFRSIQSWSVAKVSVKEGLKGPIYSKIDGPMLICLTPGGEYVYENGKMVEIREHLERLPESARVRALAWFDRINGNTKNVSMSTPENDPSAPTTAKNAGKRMVEAREKKKADRMARSKLISQGIDPDSPPAS